MADEIRLFEKLCLETFQSGLSWRTILDKRDNFRAAFAGFRPERVARFTAVDVQRLLGDAGIVRNRQKIEAVIHNAQRVCEMHEKGASLAALVWRHEAPQNPHRRPQSVSTSAESIALAKALKKDGWRFVGPTTVYAFMQAMGLVNDHVQGCVARAKVADARARFTPPRDA